MLLDPLTGGGPTGGLPRDPGPASRGDATSALCRRAIAVAIVLAVALVHLFRLGTRLPGALSNLYYSYASDIIVPPGMYFLLCVAEGKHASLRA
jgi:hypothetical protein